MRKVRQIVVLVGLLIFSAVSSYAETIKPESKIVEATVYPDSALVKRVANLNLSKGEHQVVFSGIIPDVDENSLTVSGKGTAQVRIFGVQMKKEFLTESPSQDVEKLQGDIQEISDAIAAKNSYTNVLKEEEEFLNSIKMAGQNQIPKDLITKFPEVSQLDNLSKFLVGKLKENYSQVQQASLEIRELNKKKSALEQQLQEISSGSKKLQRSIVVDLEAEKAGDLDLAISYLVRNVYWNPIYDARTSFNQDQVELVFFGVVKQSTGEPWEDVQLFLSTAKPSIGGKMPELHPWYLRPYQHRTQAAGGMLNRMAAKATDYVGQQYAPAFQEMELGAAEEKQESAMVYATAEEKGTAVVYEVKRKVSIKSDGTEHKVPISAQNLEAVFEYAATPKLSPYAYLMSKVHNSKEGQLLPGTVNIFFEGDYIGTSSIPKAIGAEENFDLYLGIDEGITVKRKKIEEKVDDTMIAGIPSRTKATSYTYKLIVENYKTKKIKVNLYDQIPVSENDQIVVKKVQFSVEPTKKDFLDRKGVVRWDFELEPKAQKEITLSYTIEHPRDMQVSDM